MSQHELEFIRQHQAERRRLAWKRLPLVVLLVALGFAAESVIQLVRYFDGTASLTRFLTPATASLILVGVRWVWLRKIPTSGE